MKRKEGQTISLSRRNLLKAGALFTLLPSLRLAALGETAGIDDPFDASRRSIDPAQPPSPGWTKDLVIYEVATKGFTSPNGPESGTFASLKDKLPYLQELGITGIWLSGYSLCDPHHFYNIWTQYAVIQPDLLDPSLGTAEDFKSLIDEAHRRELKVFLDVITHGVMSDSPLIKQHPDWFRGSSWGMTDYDWTGGHTELDDWWVKIYTDFVTKYGVDGFRLDVGIYRPDLWERIRRNAAAAGHPIAIWEESNSAIPGVTDFMQHEYFVTGIDSPQPNAVLANDMPGFYDRKHGRTGDYEVEVRYRDGEISKGSTKGNGPIGVRLAGLAKGRVGRRIWEDVPRADGLPNVRITLDHLAPKPLDDVILRSDTGEIWALRPADWRVRPLVLDAPDSWSASTIGPRVDAYISTLSWGPAIQLSCHDNGWEGFPLDKNPYRAQGSRSLFGYSVLFSPMIPVFFGGEEFDADFHPLPDLSPNVYGGKNPGKGRWLYGAMPDWNELNEPRHRDMFEDVRKMLAIRKQNSNILAMVPDNQAVNLKALAHQCNVEVPVPYLRWDEHSAILIAANRSREQNAIIKAAVNLIGTGISGHPKYKVSDLWSGTETRTFTAAELEFFEFTVKRDGIRSGGLAVFKIEAA